MSKHSRYAVAKKALLALCLVAATIALIAAISGRLETWSVAALAALSAAMLCTLYAAWVFRRQERFTVRMEDYPRVGTNPERLVVYFSRMGYTKKVALEAANQTGADVYEVRATERTDGTLGFWWCGRYGMHGWAMPIEPLSVDLSAYAHVTVCTPIWVFTPCGPIRAFCETAKGRVRSADYILVHHTRMRYDSAARELDRLLGLKSSDAVSLCCQKGKIKSRTVLRGSKQKEDIAI